MSLKMSKSVEQVRGYTTVSPGHLPPADALVVCKLGGQCLEAAGTYLTSPPRIDLFELNAPV